MNERVKPKRDPPRFGAYFAALLELLMLGVFAHHHSWMGLALWLFYFQFSALRALVEDNFRT